MLHLANESFDLQNVLLVNIIIPVHFKEFYAIKPKFFPKSSGVSQINISK